MTKLVLDLEQSNARGVDVWVAPDAVPPQRFAGSRTIVLGDSIDAAINGWFAYLCVMSYQRVTFLRNAGVGGNTTAMMLARLQSDVISYAPNICILGGATNDHSQGVPETTTRANYATMIAALRAANIRVAVRTTPPCDVAASAAPWNTVALRRAQIQRHNAWLVRWATGEGIPVLDVYSPTVDPATGGYRSAIAGDGTHPSEQGYKDMASGILANLPVMFNGRVPLPAAKGDSAYLSTNPVFIGDSNADGLADAWNLSGSTVKSLAAAVSPALGNVQHVEGDGTTIVQIYVDDPAPAARVGRVVAMTARLKVTSGTVRARLGITGTGGSSMDAGPFALPIEGVVYLEATVGPTATQVRASVFSTVGPAPIFDVSQAGLADLTDLGVL